MDLATEKDQVFDVLCAHPMLPTRLIAVRLGWIHANGRPQAWRVERAMVELAAEKRVAKVGKRWELVTKSRS